jgi:hypothetical protein
MNGPFGSENLVVPRDAVAVIVDVPQACGLP